MYTYTFDGHSDFLARFVDALALRPARIARPALNGVQWTTADAFTILDGISSEIVTRTAGPNKAFASLDLKTEPEIAHLIHVLTSGS